MRMGVGYNAFNGLELLKPSILCVRGLAHVVVVVYSRTAITGEPGSPFMMDLLHDLQRDHLVDYLIEVQHPLVDKPLLIQAEKRMKYEIARLRCEVLGCTHFMGRDCDEFMRQKQLAALLNEHADADMVVCPTIDYVKSPMLRAKTPSIYHEPVFHKACLPYRAMKMSVLMDMGRTVNARDIRVLTAEEFLIHHMNGVRYNEKECNRKQEGHSHFCLKGQGDIAKWWGRINEANTVTYEEVPDRFGVLDYWRNEFKRYYNE